MIFYPLQDKFRIKREILSKGDLSREKFAVNSLQLRSGFWEFKQFLREKDSNIYSNLGQILKKLETALFQRFIWNVKAISVINEKEIKLVYLS